MIELFNKALAFVLSWEGKYSNDPDDAGGETYRGITRKHHPEWQGWQFVDKKEWETADALVREFYFENYWLASGCDKLEPHAAMIVFDTSVNLGISGAKKLMEGTTAWQDYLINRIDRYNAIAKNGNNIKFLRGWINRTIALYKTVKKEVS